MNNLNYSIMSHVRTTVEWYKHENRNYIPMRGEICVEEVTNKRGKPNGEFRAKIGDGHTTYYDLDYAWFTPQETKTSITNIALTMFIAIAILEAVEIAVVMFIILQCMQVIH